MTFLEGEQAWTFSDVALEAHNFTSERFNEALNTLEATNAETVDVLTV